MSSLKATTSELGRIISYNSGPELINQNPELRTASLAIERLERCRSLFDPLKHIDGEKHDGCADHERRDAEQRVKRRIATQDSN
jgi:hypothetical protein